MLSLSGVAAPILFTLVVVACGVLTPEFEHLHQFISELGARGVITEKLMNYGGFIPAGTMFVVFGLVVARELADGVTGYIASTLLVLFGAGVLLAGVFSCDVGCPQSGGTLANTIHDRVSPLAFVAAIIGIGLLALRFQKIPGWEPMRTYSLMTSMLALGFLVGVVSSLESRLYTGLWQRLMLLALFTWFIVTGMRIYRRVSTER